MLHLTETPLRLDPLMDAVRAPDRGAVATFAGLVRDHHAGRTVLSLAYTADAPMAEAVCAAIVAEAETRFGARVALQHRLGDLAIGDAAVLVVAAAAHRGAAFDAVRWTIDEVKARVPIWKRERYADGSEAWVDPTAPGGTVPTVAP